jgi:predicted nucleic-acid-binding Zn-ribbon protein
MKKGKCPKCGSKEIMAGVEVRDDGRSSSHPLRVVVEEPEPPKHGSVWVQPLSTGDVLAWICGNCGYTELYTNNLGELLRSYKHNN